MGKKESGRFCVECRLMCVSLGVIMFCGYLRRKGRRMGM